MQRDTERGRTERVPPREPNTTPVLPHTHTHTQHTHDWPNPTIENFSIRARVARTNRIVLIFHFKNKNQ